MGGRTWTESETAAVRARYRREPTAAIAVALGRTTRAVQVKARALGLAEDRAPRWTVAEDAAIRRDFPRAGIAGLAATLGRTRSAVEERVRALGLGRRPVWTEAEEAELRRLYSLTPRPPRAEMARAFGRSREAIGQKAKAMKLSDRNFVCRTSHLAEIRRLHSLGRSDREIADELGTNRVTARRYRRDILGLASNAVSEHRKARVASATRAQVEREGLRSLADLRDLALRLEVFRRGWPPEVSRRGADVLDLLRERGPLTGIAIRDAMGLRHVPQSTLNSLERLRAVSVGRRATKLGNVYTLAVVPRERRVS